MSDEQTFSIPSGDNLIIRNDNAGALRVRVEFGEGGSVVVTLAPRQDIKIITGTESRVNYYLEEFIPAGIRTVD